jgi:ribosomal protein S18 acetylase RimI-like enzyme
MATTARSRPAGIGDRAIKAAASRDKAMLRAFLERDRLRAAYAVCDLDEKEFHKTKWGVAYERGEPIAVVLEFGGLTPQPLFVTGDVEGVASVLRDVIKPRIVYLAADASHLPAVERSYRIDEGPQMVRMVVNRQTFRPSYGPVVRLAPADIVDLNRLYGLGFAGWLPSDSIANGVYYGVRVAGRLVAAAGTHVISADARMAAVGNVMTHHDFRGRGFAKAATSAVTQELLRTCDDVVLNVRSDNPPALAAYTAIGYFEHNRFEERLAHRRGTLSALLTAPIRRLLSSRQL